jgi:anthranilate synthase component II
MTQKILLIDNQDSFTYNIAELLRSIGKVSFNIVLSKNLDASGLRAWDAFIFSPGPGLPDEHPVMPEILERWGAEKKILGVCLGLQAIAVHYGAKLYNLDTPVHGQAKKIIPAGDHPVFRNIPSPFQAGLYHSWAVNKESLPACLKITAVSDDGVIMALSHKTLPVTGVQFHPESILTKFGLMMMENWVNS